MKGAKVLFSKKDDEHITPPEILDRLETTFKIKYDPCPSPNYLHRQFRDENEKRGTDFSDLPWPDVPIFINPPYSDLDLWADLAVKQFQTHPNNPIVMLVPARTDRPFFEKLFNHAHAIGFIRGRLKFMLADSDRKGILKKSNWSAPFPSMLVVFEKNVSISRNIEILQCLKDLNCVTLALNWVMT